MADEEQRPDRQPSGPDVQLAPELGRTLESVMDEDSLKRMREAAEAARQSVTIVNAPDAAPGERAASARELSARFRDEDEIDEAGRGGGALGRAVTRQQTHRWLSLVLLVVVTAILGLILVRWLRPADAPSQPKAPAGDTRLP